MSVFDYFLHFVYASTMNDQLRYHPLEQQCHTQHSLRLQWNLVNTGTIGPYKFDCINGGGSSVMTGLCIVR